MAACTHVLALPKHAAAQCAVPTKRGLSVWVVLTSGVEQLREVELSIKLFQIWIHKLFEFGLKVVTM